MKKLLIVLSIILISISLISCKKEDTLTTTTKETTTTTMDYSNIFKGVNDLNQDSKMYEIKYFEIEENNIGYLRSILNPYKSKDITITSTITTPSNTEVVKDAYYKLDYDIKYDDFYTVKDTAIYKKKEHFLISYKPKEEGLHHIDIKVYIKENLTQEFSLDFNVLESTLDYKGVIRVSDNKKTFVFESGETYIPLGENVGWYTSKELKSFEYDEIFERLSEVGGNYARIWLKAENFALHMGSSTAKVDDFTIRMADLERLDRVLKVAEEKGIYVCLTLLNHGQFSKRINPEWNKNPYKELIDYPFLFFMRDEVKEIYKDELRYIISRYTEYDSIFTYELFNETDWTDSYDSTYGKKWAEEMSLYIKSIDPYDRLITSSFVSNSNGIGVFKLDSIDYYTIHTYNYQSAYGVISRMKSEALNAYSSIYKPVLYEEWGVNSDSGPATYEMDPNGITLCQALYASIFSSSGSAMTWWWDTYIKKYDLYNVFKGPFKCASYFNLDKEFVYFSKENIGINNDNLDLLGIKTDTSIYLYIYDMNYTRLQEEETVFSNIELDYDFTGYEAIFLDAKTGEEVTLDLSNLTFTNDLVIILNINK